MQKTKGLQIETCLPSGDLSRVAPWQPPPGVFDVKRSCCQTVLVDANDSSPEGFKGSKVWAENKPGTYMGTLVPRAKPCLRHWKYTFQY